MKVIKPHRLGLLHRVVEHRRKHTLVVSVLTYVPLADARKLLMEVQLHREATELVPAGVIDEGLPKPQAEVLVSGSAFAPAGKPTKGVETRLTLSRDDDAMIDKRLIVVGNRYWVGSSPSEPIPFTEMPLDWAHAFGGEAHAHNPYGKGAVPIQTDDGEVVPLPNVENPAEAIAGPEDRPLPAGYGAYEVSWPARMQHVGSDYGEAWLKECYPGPALDFDPRFYNTAPEDQRIDGHFTGNERLTISGMHPEQSKLEAALTPLVVRAFATQRAADGDEHFVAIDTRPDTIHVFPALGTMAVIYRGTLQVTEDDADDIAHLIIAAEDPEEPKAMDHYRGVLAKRLDKELGALHSMKDEDLLPSQARGWLARPDFGDMAEITRVEHRHRENMDRGRKKKLAATKARLEAAGFDVGDAFSEPEPVAVPDPFDADAILATMEEMEKRTLEAQEELKSRHDNLESDLRTRFTDAGFDYDEHTSTFEPPTFSADDHLIMLHDMARIAAEGGEPLEDLERDLANPQYEEALRGLEERVKRAYQQFAHLMPATTLPDDEQRQQLRTRIQIAHEVGESLADQQLYGADLHGLDLSGIDLSRTILEGADLSSANLAGANLHGAVLTRAKLTGTNLSGADLTDANLGDCMLDRTDLSEAKCHRTTFMRSELNGALLVEADLQDVDFLETQFTHADFSHAQMSAPLFVNLDLRGAHLAGAELESARFVQVDVRNVDFTGARMSRAQFVKARADGATFSGANLTGAVFVHETSLTGASFANANLTSANLRESPLRDANFRAARLEGADLSKCDLRGSDMSGMKARNAMMMRTDFRGAKLRGVDLLGAILAKARLEGADLSGSNLSRADMALVHTDGATKLDGTLSLDTRVDPQRPRKEARP